MTLLGGTISCVRLATSAKYPNLGAVSDRHHAWPQLRRSTHLFLAAYAGLASPKIGSAILRQLLTDVRTISTEHLAWRATNSATLPSKKRWMPPRPCEPTTIRSARHAAAESLMLSPMSPTYS